MYRIHNIIWITNYCSSWSHGPVDSDNNISPMLWRHQHKTATVKDANIVFEQIRLLRWILYCFFKTWTDRRIMGSWLQRLKHIWKRYIWSTGFQCPFMRFILSNHNALPDAQSDSNWPLIWDRDQTPVYLGSNVWQFFEVLFFFMFFPGNYRTQWIWILCKRTRFRYKKRLMNMFLNIKYFCQC